MDAKQAYDLRQQFKNFGKQIMLRRAGNLDSGVEEVLLDIQEPCVVSFMWSTNHGGANVRVRPYVNGVAVVASGPIQNDGQASTLGYVPGTLRDHPNDVFEVLEREIGLGTFAAVMWERVFAEGVYISIRNTNVSTPINMAARVEGRRFPPG